MKSLTSEKLAQAVELTKASQASVWLTFVRETSLGGDPVLPLIIEGGLTWLSALIVSESGEKVAVLGNYDADPLRTSGNWDTIVPYVQGIRQPMLEQLERLVPQDGKIAINFSIDDVKADGMSHGMYLLLEQYLAGTRFAGSLVSAQEIVSNLRGVKSPSEIERLRCAIAETDRLFLDIAGIARKGLSERHVFECVQRLIEERRLGYAWEPAANPIVNSGPNSMIGHGLASLDIRIEAGHVFHVDLGVVKDGYASDMQRCWYVSDGGEIPKDVADVFAAVNGAISAGAAALKPGAKGHEVDAAARSHLVGCGYEEYLHAFGHQVGRVAHDGGAVLGPQWERYGGTPNIPIRAGEVYTLELGVIMKNRGYLGLEEMVVVRDNGVEFLTNRQLELPVIW